MTWFRTTPVGEMISALEFSASCGSRLREEPATWRWFILSLHLALQGALVCGLKGFDNSGVLALPSSSARRTQEWLQAGAPTESSPNQHLASVRELLVRAQAHLPQQNRLPFDQRAINELLQLNEIRNSFVHLVEDGWSLDLSGLPRISLTAVAAIEHLAVKAPTFWHHLEDYDAQRIGSAIANLRVHMHSLDAARAGAAC